MSTVTTPPKPTTPAPEQNPDFRKQSTSGATYTQWIARIADTVFSFHTPPADDDTATYSDYSIYVTVAEIARKIKVSEALILFMLHSHQRSSSRKVQMSVYHERADDHPYYADGAHPYAYDQVVWLASGERKKLIAADKAKKAAESTETED